MQEEHQLLQRLCAVAEAVFARRVELGGRHAQVGKVEQGVVAEAVRAARGTRDFASPDPLGDERVRILRMPYEYHDAAIMSPSLLPQAAKKLRVVARIALLPAAV